MNDYLSKPILLHVLAACLKKWLTPTPNFIPSDSRLTNFPTQVVIHRRPSSSFIAFDKTALLSSIMNDMTTAQEICRMFIDCIPMQIDRLRQGVEARNLEIVWRQAIKIQETADMVGGIGLSFVAKAFRDVNNHDQELIAKHMSELDSELARLKEAMEHEMLL